MGDDAFLSRWARRKADARQGKLQAEPEPEKSQTAVAPKQMPVSHPAGGSVQTVHAQPTPQTAQEIAEPPPLTLEDAKALTQHSDFKPFMAQRVEPEVRNAAMKKLFSDPHYNVMDGLDIYIDDYTKSDPIPESMLRQMVGAQFLKLFDHELTPGAAAQSTESTEPPTPTDHANTHLRLQPDHAPAYPDTGSSAA